MLQICAQCPGFQTVQSHFLQKFEYTDEQIYFKQWVSVDKTELSIQILTVQKYIDLFLSKLEALAHHHLILHAQSAHLKQHKETMNKDAALMLRDFAENCPFHF